MGHLQELLLGDVYTEGRVLAVSVSHLLVFLHDELAGQAGLELDPGVSRLIFHSAGGEEDVHVSEVVTALNINTAHTGEIRIKQTLEHFVFSDSTIRSLVSCFCILSMDSNTSLCSISSSFSKNQIKNTILITPITII